MKLKKRHWGTLLRLLRMPLCVWSGVIVSFGVAILLWDSAALTQQAKLTAVQVYERDMLFRKWNASHGGVYVPVSDTSPPNPYLDFLPERDVVTTDGRQLTLMNPAYMTRQVHEMGNAELAIQAHLTSLNPIAADNLPDEWEEGALRRFKSRGQGAAEVVEVVETREGRVLRFMKPFMVKEACLKCHAQQGYRVGDVRGGLSVTVPLPKLALKGVWFKLACLVALWGSGVLGLFWWGGRQTVLEKRFDHTREKQQRVESSLRFLENYDRQTHLPNRNHLLEKFRQAILRQQGTIGLLLIDFPEMSRLQRAYSDHLVTMLLRKAAERVAGCLFQSDLVARVGDYRVAVLLPHLVARGNLQLVADKLSREFEVPLGYEDEEFQVTPVFGASSSPEDGNDAETIFSCAVSGLEEGRRQFPHQVSYAPKSSALLQRRIQLEKDLRRALRNRELQVYYQPQIDACSGRMVGAEALVRWNHAERGMISPAEFIPWAEEAGLMGPLGEYVMFEACKHFTRLAELGWRDLRLSLNLSAHQFRDPELVERIDAALQRSGLPATSLELEITEGSFIEDFDCTVAVLTELKSLGVSIAIDDFGTGFSSLSYLSRLPIDTLKIDRSFIKELEQQVEAEHIVDAIISMADKLGIGTVAEGVENASQVERLTAMGGRVMQGFYYAKPLDGFDLEKYLAQLKTDGLQNQKTAELATA